VAAENNFNRAIKMLPSSSQVPMNLGLVGRRQGHWDQSIAYLEQALALDPRNVQVLMTAASTYSMVRQFPSALELYDRALDNTPNDSQVMAAKANIYQGQGKIQEAARFLSGVNEQTPYEDLFLTKITQLRLERNYREALRLLQARESQFHFDSQFDKGTDQVGLAFTQWLAGDAADAKATAEQAHNTLEQLYRDQPDNVFALAMLSQAYALKGEKASALTIAERAMMLLPSAKDRVSGPALEENLALIQTIVGENSRAISVLAQLLQTPYHSCPYVYNATPVTPALLRVDPFWDPLRGDPAFQKLCQEKQPPATP
jgi:tetratricopeptide (TPR) repeat protein